MKLLSHSLPETQAAAIQILGVLKGARQSGWATVVGLRGDLGSGKTTFSQSIAHELGVVDRVTSPTFIIEKIYDTTDDTFKKFIHIDAYRLEHGDELSKLDFDTVLADSNNLIFIEWPEKVESILSTIPVFTISFESIDENTRSISYEE
ncbi:MAG: hypothetical protein RL094_59 [Candidatus Parcubacteria bacterium]|jgi:tRNA threonylcarbamoyladenosine biosynthesis protein TsaE